MRADSRRISQVLRKCIITTSEPLLALYEEMVCNSKVDSLLIYNCLYEENAETIPAAHNYEIVIDFNNDNIYSIIIKMFNKLLKFDCDLYVDILEIPRVNNENIELSIKLLKRLENSNLIKLKIQDHTIHRYIKGLLKHPLDNVTCFIGPGNTGKTSIMASVSELFYQTKQRIALLDFTKDHKLRGYFPHSIDISNVFMDHGVASHDNEPHLYTYDTQGKYGLSETAFLCKAIDHLSRSYDFLLINADEHRAKNSIDIFKLFTNIFIVHDCTLNKIPSTHRMLLSFQEAGIDTQKTVSMIYNKVVKKALDIGNIEEKLIFKRDEKGHLLPLIDIKCMTLEIFHTKKVAAALNNKIMMKSDALSKASVNYIINIKRLYNSINNLKDYEYSDLQLSEFVRNHVCDIVHNLFSIKVNQRLRDSTWLNDVYNSTMVIFEKWINSIKALRDRYLNNKSVA